MNPPFCNSFFRIFALAFAFCTAVTAFANTSEKPGTNNDRPAPRPYKVLTAGKRVTVQSKTEINKIMVWTSSGRRIVEENNVKTLSYSFMATNSEKFFFIMLELKDGKRYTEKIGV